jgi:hypothetical protein
MTMPVSTWIETLARVTCPPPPLAVPVDELELRLFIVSPHPAGYNEYRLIIGVPGQDTSMTKLGTDPTDLEACRVALSPH